MSGCHAARIGSGNDEVVLELGEEHAIDDGTDVGRPSLRQDHLVGTGTFVAVGEVDGPLSA